jgi:hypothetical protein
MRWGCEWVPAMAAPDNGWVGGAGSVTVTASNVGGGDAHVGRVTVDFTDGTTGALLGQQSVEVGADVRPGSSARVSVPGTVGEHIGSGGYGYADWCGIDH